MDLFILILLIAAFILFALAALQGVSPARYNLVAAGLACWMLTVVFAAARNAIYAGAK